MIIARNSSGIVFPRVVACPGPKLIRPLTYEFRGMIMQP